MKAKKYMFMLAVATALALTACGENKTTGTAAVTESRAEEDQATGSTETGKYSDTAEASSATADEVSIASENVSAATEISADGKSHILIAWFSVMETDGVDTVSSASRVAVDGKTMGNNEYLASLIEQKTGGDLFRIETVEAYPTTHKPLLEFAYNEKMENARPELAASIDHLEQYDVIFLGYPNWNADLPMPLYTFLEEYDFSGKTIIPFTSHGGSGFSRTVQTIEELQPNATVVEDGLSISRNDVADAKMQVTDWIQELGVQP